MSRTVSKEELVRLGWITELRRQGDRQCTNGAYTHDRLVCALGLLREVALPRLSPEEREGWDEVADVGAFAGLSENQSTEVTLRNDGDDELGFHKHTFAEIADVVEGWFK